MSELKLSAGVVPLPLQIRCVARELAMRRNYYPKAVRSGRMKPDEAQKEIEHMEAVLHTLQELAGRRN